MMKEILSAYDGSDAVRAALDYTCELAKKYGSHIHVIAVCQPPEFVGEVELQVVVKKTQAHFNSMRKQLKNHHAELGSDTKFRVVTGHPAEQLLRYADGNQIDHIVRDTAVTHCLSAGSWVRWQDRLLIRCPVTVIRQ